MQPLTVRSVSFGMDIGGTLAKVVYFEPDHPADAQAAGVVRTFITNSEHYGLTGKRCAGNATAASRLETQAQRERERERERGERQRKERDGERERVCVCVGERE